MAAAQPLGSNTHINGADVTLRSGGDTRIAGGVVEGETITVDVGGDFDLHSLQDTGQRDNMSAGFGFGFDPTKMAGGAGFGGISSVTPSFGIGSGSTAWVTEQTGLFSSGDTDVSVGGATDILGAVIGSSEGDVTIDTATLTFADLTDHDNYTDFAINATFNSALWTAPQPTSGSPSDQPERNPVCASIGGCTSPNWTAQGHYAYDDRAQNTVTTIGVGSGSSGDTAPTGINRDGKTQTAEETQEESNQSVTITIRDTEAQQELEDSGQTAGVDEINSDLALAQVLTKDEHERVDFYLSDSSLKAALNAGKTVGEILGGAMALLNETALDAAFKDGLSPTEAIKQIRACKNAQHGFNLFDYIFATAHAATGCIITYKKKKKDGTWEEKKIPVSKTKSCEAVLLEGLKKISFANIWQVGKGFGKGIGKTLEGYADLVQNPEAVAKAVMGMMHDLYSDPEKFAIDMKEGLKNGLIEKYGKLLVALEKNDMSGAGEILGSLTTDMVLGVVAGGVSGVVVKAIRKRIKNRKDNDTTETADNGGSCNKPGGCTTCSFAPNTPVLMADGSLKPISMLEIGNIVASRNEVTGLYSSRPLTNVYNSWHEDKVTLSVVDDKGTLETLTTTIEHPFFVTGQGFMRADSLKVGMELSSHTPRAPPVQQVGLRALDSSGALRIKAITIARSGAGHRAWNLTVDKDHTFFVGNSRAWVHNDCLGDARKAQDDLRKDSLNDKGEFDPKIYADKLSDRLETVLKEGNSAKFEAAKKALWEAGDWTRGLAIERFLAKTKYKNYKHVGEMHNGFFPYIDFSKVPRVAISVKTSNYGKIDGDDFVKRMVDHMEKQLKDLEFSSPVGNVNAARLDIHIPKGQRLSPQHRADLRAAQQRTGVRVRVRNF